MTDHEAFYDEEIAPALLALGNLCKARDIPFLAYVGYNSEENSGQTVYYPKDPGPSVMLIAAALKARGNLDALCIGLARYTMKSKRPHSSIALRAFGVEPSVEDRKACE